MSDLDETIIGLSGDVSSENVELEGSVNSTTVELTTGNLSTESSELSGDVSETTVSLSGDMIVAYSGLGLFSIDQLDARYLRKLVEDTANENITFKKNIYVLKNIVANVIKNSSYTGGEKDGTGFFLGLQSSGESLLEVDNLIVRKSSNISGEGGGGGTTGGKYWANIETSDLPSDETVPTFKSIKIGGVTIDTDNDGYLHVNNGVYSDSFVSAFGLSSGGSEGGGGIIQSVLGFASLGTTLTDDNTVTFNAYAINEIWKKASKALTSVDWEIISNTPKTLTGYGISASDSLLASKLDASKFTQANIKSTLGISDWALNESLLFSDLPDMYWANVKVASASSDTTTPTFKSIKIGGVTIDTDTNGYLHIDKGVYTDSFLSAFGLSSGGGSSITGYLNDLEDVVISSPTNGQVLKYNGTSWVNSSDSGITTVYWNNIKDIPTTIAGYGITDAYTKTETDDLLDEKFDEDDFTKANIKSKLGISDWALASVRPTYKYGDSDLTGFGALATKSSLAFSEITGSAAFSQLPTMYWANVKVSSSSSTSTAPTFSSVKIGSATLSWDSTNSCLKVDKGFASDSFLSAFGVSSGGGSGSASYINDLLDVTISNPASGQILSYDGSNWVNKTYTNYVTIAGTQVQLGGSITAKTIGAALTSSAPATYATSAGKVANALTYTEFDGTARTFDGSTARTISNLTLTTADSNQLKLVRTNSTKNYATGIKFYSNDDFNGAIGMSGSDSTTVTKKTPYWACKDSNDDDVYYQIAYSTAKTAVGSSTLPVYVGADGKLVAISSYGGNSATATKLAIARTIYGNSFDGSANVTGTIANSYLANSKVTIAGIDVSLGNSIAASSLGAKFTTSAPAAYATTSGTCSGNAATATKLKTAATIWGQSFDGSSEISGTLTIANNKSVSCNDSGGNARNILYLSSGNNLYLGADTAAAGYRTTIQGKDILFQYGTSKTSGMYIDDSGNVGIGMTTQTEKLCVKGNISATSQFISTLKTGTKPIDVTSTTMCDNLNADMLDGFHAIDAGRMGWVGLTKNTTTTATTIWNKVATINAAANTTNAFAEIEIAHNGRSNTAQNRHGYIAIRAYSYGVITATMNTEGYGAGIMVCLSKSDSDTSNYHTDVWIGTQSSYTGALRYRVTKKPTDTYITLYDSDIVTATDNPSTKYITNNGYTRMAYTRSGDSGAYQYAISSGYPTATDGNITNIAHIDSLLYFDTTNGRIGIGEDEPTQALDVAGNILASGEITAYSDMRLKDVKSDTKLSLDSMANAPLFKFTWKNRKDEQLHVGSSAQYWKGVVPELVLGSEDTHYALNYATLGVAMGISLADEVKRLKERVKELESKFIN